ncbi:MAG: hypothetical protein AB1642_00220 [Pseudomonadota bacterium]
MKRLAALALFLAIALPAVAEDNVLLIQQGPEGFRVWHTEGASVLSDDEVLEIMATAQPEGGETVATPLGPARAFEMPAGIVIRLPEAPSDKALLVDRDACGHIQLWHAEGATQLSDNDLFELVHSAKPDGGPRLLLGERYAKAFLGKLGVTATLWRVPPKK